VVVENERDHAVRRTYAPQPGAAPTPDDLLERVLRLGVPYGREDSFKLAQHSLLD
jgi:hypothetical protein